MGLIRRLVFYLVVLLFPNTSWSAFSISPDNPVIAFCNQKTFQGFTLSACPGGIQFLSEQPQRVCNICFNNLHEVKLPSECNVDPTVYVSDPDGIASWIRSPPNLIKDRLLNESQQLVEYTMRRDQQGAKLSETFNTYPQNLRMLDLSRKIFQKVADRILDSHIIERAFGLVEYLYHDANPIWHMDSASLQMITYGLQKCHDFVKPIQTSEFTCRDNCYFDINNNTITTPAAKLYNKDENDPLIELMWKAFETSHALCFKHFSFDPNLYHKFQLEMNNFFKSVPVQMRWMRSITELEREAYRMILPGLSNDLLKTADAVVETIISDATTIQVYGRRLVKPNLSKGNGSYVYDVHMKACNSGVVLWGGLACCLTEKLEPVQDWCAKSTELCKTKSLAYIKH